MIDAQTEDAVRSTLHDELIPHLKRKRAIDLAILAALWLFILLEILLLLDCNNAF